MVLVLMDMAMDSTATVDTLPPHTPTDTDTHQLTDMVLTGSTSVMPRLSQRLMPTTVASMVPVPMVLVLMDMAMDSTATVDTLPPHTPTAMDTHQLTDMVPTGSTSVMPMLSQRLMPTTVASMVPVLTDTDTHLTDTGHTDMLPHTAMATAAQLTLTDTIKLPMTV